MGNIGEILNWTLTASSIGVLVFFISTLFGKKIRKTYQCALWGIVLIRLLIPNMPSSSLSLFNLVEGNQMTVAKESGSKWERAQNLSVEALRQIEQVESPINEFSEMPTALEKSNGITSEDSKVVVQSISIEKILYHIWLVGVLVLGGYYIYSYIRAKKRIKALETVEAEEILHLFESCSKKLKLSKASYKVRLAYWDTSMIFGLKHPTITVPKHGNKKELEMILLHELTHYKYKHYWLTYIQLIALTLHWFNPLVWLVIKQMKEDIEYACDERVIRLGISKKNYAQTLLNMVQPLKQELAFVQGMGDAPKQVKNRIQKIVSLKQGKRISSILSVILVGLLTVGCLTDATSSKSNGQEKWTGTQNVALLGLDQDGMRIDTIIVASINCETGNLEMVSIPRDTKIILDEEEKATFNSLGATAIEACKINEIYAYLGEEGLETVLFKELEKLVELEINHYVLINPEEAKKVVDALGGIDVEIPQAMRYDDYAQDLHICLDEGMQHLDGEKTMQAVRFRRYENGDLGRVEMNQKVLMAILRATSNISSLEDFEAVVQGVKETISTNISLLDMARYYDILKKVQSSDSYWYILPGEGRYEDGASYYIIDEEARVEMVASLHTDKE